MKAKEMKEVIVEKNTLIMQQARRIDLLEAKMTELRQRYFQLVYANGVMQEISDKYIGPEHLYTPGTPSKETHSNRVV